VVRRPPADNLLSDLERPVPLQEDLCGSDKITLMAFFYSLRRVQTTELKTSCRHKVGNVRACILYHVRSDSAELYLMFSQAAVPAVGSEVLTPVVMKSTVFWDTLPCGPLKVNRLRYVPPKRQLTFNGLHGVISQNIVLFRSTRSSPGTWLLFNITLYCSQNFKDRNYTPTNTLSCSVLN
jgi:hypothetical protein